MVLVAKQKYKEVLGRQKTVCSNVETQTEEEDIRETQPDTVKVTSAAEDSERKEEERHSNFDDEDDIKTMYAVRSVRDKLPGVQRGAGKKRTIKRTVKWIPY